MSVQELKTRNTLNNEEAIDLLHKYLSEAEAGNIIAVAVAAIAKDGSSHTSATRTENYPALLGAVAIILHRMISERNI